MDIANLWKLEKRHLDFLSNLDTEKKNKLIYLSRVADFYTLDLFEDMRIKHILKREISKPKYKNYRNFINDELFKAGERLTMFKIPANWRLIIREIDRIRDDLKSDKGLKFAFSNSEGINLLFLDLITSAELRDEYLNHKIEYKNKNQTDFNPDNLPDFEKVIEFLAHFNWLAYLMRIVENKYSFEKKEQFIINIPFDQIFRPEYRKHTPKEVLRILGPGEADAWSINNSEREWTYKGPESAIIIPFYTLCDMGYITIPPKGKKEYLTTWLKTFGKEYKPKTFDKSPLDYKSNEYFKDYLNKLK